MSPIRIAIPVIVGVAAIALWQGLVHVYDVPVYVLPSPGAIWPAFTQSFAELMTALWTTLQVTALAFLLAFTGAMALAILFNLSRTVEMALFPYAVILQVTPMVSIAPLILIWVGFERVELAATLIAAIVAFFPILSSATVGLRSADANLNDLYRLYGATRWQRLVRLQLPAALPYILPAVRVSAGLALIGAIVAEFVAGSGTATGLGWVITEAGHNLEIAKMFAALALLSAVGVGMFYALTFVEWLLLHRWHESAVKQQN
ncbi:MAG TPA: ABC transporter permease [Rhizomicrobium sp.]|jgi:NitT/TauT family transport system permease protein